MAVKLWRIFNIFSRKGTISLIFACIAAIFPFIFEDKKAHNLAINIFTSVGLFLFILIFSSLMGSPKSFELGERSVKYKENIYNTSSHGGMVRMRGIPRPVYYTVKNVREVEFLQNSIERLFDVGRIRFRGVTQYEGKGAYIDNVPDRKVHTICGIPNFCQFQKDADKYFDSNEKSE